VIEVVMCNAIGISILIVLLFCCLVAQVFEKSRKAKVFIIRSIE
jgi:hypothetical protein